MHRSAFVVLAAILGIAGCNAETGSRVPETTGESVLGPVDGRDLPGMDLDRIQVGDVAPDFSLISLAGPVVTLSDFRGEKNVILVFYRGYW